MKNNNTDLVNFFMIHLRVIQKNFIIYSNFNQGSQFWSHTKYHSWTFIYEQVGSV